MDHAEFRKRLREVMREEADLPWEEWIRPLVEKGIVDWDGNVLVCMPPPPRTVYDEEGNATIIYPDLSQPPPPVEPGRKPRAKADARTKTKAKPRKPKPGKP